MPNMKKVEEASEDGLVEEADTEGHMPRVRVPEADTEGHGFRHSVEEASETDLVEEADTEGHRRFTGG